MEAMMKPGPLLMTLIVGALSAGGAGAASDRGTPAEAKAMLQKAVAHYTSVGRKQALADFTAKKAPFGDRDLYVACIGPGRLISANGAFPAYVGTSVNVLKDANAKPVGNAMWD